MPNWYPFTQILLVDKFGLVHKNWTQRISEGGDWYDGEKHL